MDRFSFTPDKGFEDASSFPDPGSESAAREQLMRLHNQMKEYVNSMADVVSSLEISTGDPDAVARIEAAIAEIQSFLNVSPYVTFLEDEE
jgi:hypothetical protein